MLRLLIFLVIGFAFYRLAKIFFRKGAGSSRRRTGDVETFRDPVCGTYVTKDDAIVERRNGETIYFCSRKCLEKYRRDY